MVAEMHHPSGQVGEALSRLYFSLQQKKKKSKRKKERKVKPQFSFVFNFQEASKSLFSSGPITQKGFLF